MSEPISWVFQAGESCAYCKEGLCQRMNQLMEDGYSQRKASKVMEAESEGQWSAEQIRRIFKYWMSGTNCPTPKKPKEVKEPVLEFAMLYAKMAVAQLESICNGHPDREEAFDYVLKWINKNR